MNLKYRVNTEQKVNNFPKIRPEEKCARKLENRIFELKQISMAIILPISICFSSNLLLLSCPSIEQVFWYDLLLFSPRNTEFLPIFAILQS